jgi:hypothetical protein
MPSKPVAKKPIPGKPQAVKPAQKNVVQKKPAPDKTKGYQGPPPFERNAADVAMPFISGISLYVQKLEIPLIRGIATTAHQLKSTSDTGTRD